MDNLKINWNDHIADFIKIKANKPHILTQLIKVEQQHLQQKSNQRKVQQHQSKYNQLTSNIFQQNNRLQSIRHHKTLLATELKKIDKNCHLLEWEIDKYSRELQENKKMKSSRSSLTGTNYTNSERSQPLLKKQVHIKISNYEHNIHETQNEISKLVAYRISLKEDIQRYKNRLNNFQSSKKVNQQKTKIKQQLSILKIKQQELKQKNLKLSTIRHQKISQYHKPFKITKKQYSLLQDSTKKLQTFIKDAKKHIFSDKLQTNKKYQQFVYKYKKQLQNQNLTESQNELSKMLQKHIQLKIIIEQGHAVLNMGKYQQLFHQMIQQSSKKDINPIDYLQMDQNLQAAEQYLRQLQRRDISLNNQIEAMKKNLQRKAIELQNERLRIKSNRSI